MKRLVAAFASVVLALFLMGCAGQPANENASQGNDDQGGAVQQQASVIHESASNSDSQKEVDDLVLTINDEVIPVIWKDNAAVSALRDQASNAPIVVRMSMYGGNEQVGPLGKNYPAADAQTTTHCGDIVLYAKSNIVVFYGSNDWSYTRLGKIDLPDDQVKDLLSNGDVTLTLSR